MMNQITIKKSHLIYIFIFFSPFSIYGISLGGGAGLTPINCYTLLLFFLLILQSLKRGRIPDITIVGRLHIAFIIVSMISIIMAEQQFPGMRGTGAYFIKFFLAFLVPVVFIKYKKDLERAAIVFIIAGLFNAIMGWTELIGYYVFHKIIFPPGAAIFGNKLTLKAFGWDTGAMSIPGFMRMFGFMNSGANSFGTYLIAPFGLSVYFIFKNKTHIWLLLAGFFFLTIMASVSRNAIVGTFVFLLAVFLFRSRNVPSLVFRIYGIIFFIGTFLLFSLMAKEFDLYAGSKIRIDRNTEISTPLVLIARLNPLTDSSFNKSSHYFTDHLKIAIIHSTDNFGFGLGPQNFDDYAYDNYDVIGYGCHSNFISFLGSTGVWGLLIQIIIICIVIKYSIATMKQNKTRTTDLALYLLSIFIGLVVTGIIRTYYLDTYTFIIMGFIVRLYYLNNKSREQIIHENFNPHLRYFS